MKIKNKNESQKKGPPSGKKIPAVPNENIDPLEDHWDDPEEDYRIEIEDPEKIDSTRIDDPPPTKPIKPIK